jgi:hypothetical protein
MKSSRRSVRNIGLVFLLVLTYMLIRKFKNPLSGSTNQKMLFIYKKQLLADFEYHAKIAVIDEPKNRQHFASRMDLSASADESEIFKIARRT